MGYKEVYKSPTRPQQVVGTLDLKDYSVKKTVINHWIVLTDDRYIQPLDVLTASANGTNVPTLGDTISEGQGNTSTFVVRVQPERSAENPFAFNVQVESVVLPPYLVGFTTGQKLNIKMKTDGIKFQETIDFDKDNKAICNSANQPFDPAPQRAYYDEKMLVEYDTDIPPFDTYSGARGRVNGDSGTFTVSTFTRNYIPRQLLLENASWETTFLGAGSSSWWHVSIELLYRKDGFVNKYLDQGYYVKNPSAGTISASNTYNPELIVAADSNGVPVNAPVRLDGSGFYLPAASTPVYLPYKIELETNFFGFLTDIHP